MNLLQFVAIIKGEFCSPNKEKYYRDSLTSLLHRIQPSRTAQ